MIRRSLAVMFVLVSIESPGVGFAHSASDAYLTVSVEKSPASSMPQIHGQWDIALRDLDFVLKLDADGDGRVTWREVRTRQAEIAAYAYRYLRVEGGAGNPCSLQPERQLIDDHADGAYAALFFSVTCAKAPKKLTLHYQLFFSIDPSHRGIFVMHSGVDVATALLSPENAKIDLAL